MTESSPTKPAEILVIAANGKTGRRVADRVEARGVKVRRGSRRGPVVFDWNVSETWAPALAGVEAAYVVYTPDLAVPQALPNVQQLSEIAKQQGVRKLVLLSGRGEPEAQAVEAVVQASGLAWTVVRAGWFSQNFSEGEFAAMVADGVLPLPETGYAEPFVDVDDIAEVAAAALLDPRHDGEVYEVTGPQLLTFAEVAEKLSEAAGRPIAYLPISLQAFADGLTEAGVPADFVELLRYLFGRMATGVNAHVSDGIERALGRPGRSFSSYAQAAAAAGAFAATQLEASHV
jgi:uncharacterized protein YbjT (DUF2867 family)